MTATLLLDARSLLSKFGFGDGGKLGDWWLDSFDELPTFDETVVLCALVREHLVPAVVAAGHAIEVEEISTNHNPIRVNMLDGKGFDHYADTDALDNIWVVLDREAVMKAAHGVAKADTPK
jgi:hypothetical protein